MRLSDCRDSYYYNSQKVSDISRNLAFAGLALIWAFRVSGGKVEVIPSDLRWAGTFLVVGLALDFFQYVVSTIIWGVYNRIKENNLTSKDEDFLAPRWINYPANFFFYSKQVFIAYAYFLIIRSMFGSFWT